jgi:prophage DNA circulation protein
MENDRDRIDFQERVEARQKESLEWILTIVRRCDEEAEARRREWEEAKGREMTRAEKIDAHHDEFLIKMSVTTQAQVDAIKDLGEKWRESQIEIEKTRVVSEREWEESRAEARAGRDALLRMLDRLPPRDGE